MRPRVLTAALAGFLLAGAPAFCADRPDIGKREYDSNCAACHGFTGKGDGPYKPYLTRSPTDLSMLSKNNNGVLPVARMYSVIEGGADVPGHGGRDMPIWGWEYRIKAAEYYADVPYDPEVYVRSRILALIDYISRLQAK